MVLMGDAMEWIRKVKAGGDDVFRRLQSKSSPHLLQSRERKRERAEERRGEERRGKEGRGTGLAGLGRMQL